MNIRQAVIALAASVCLLASCGTTNSAAPAPQTTTTSVKAEENKTEPTATTAISFTSEQAATDALSATSEPITTTGSASETQAMKTIPQELEEVPQAYFSAASQQGTLADLYYDTYESFSYEEKTRPLQKHAVVYLPYGYSDDEQYNIVYLMHGGWSNENTTLGTPASPGGFKNMLDNAIADGKMQPLIVVCPTYNNTNENGQDSDSFSLAMQLTRNYHNELVNDLIPAVEGRYSTYGSRDHRAFVGFSMGSVTTWRTFQYCLNEFRYFVPMSCGTTLDESEIFAAAKDFDKSDYFVWVMTGTEDFAYSYDERRVGLMRSSEYFTESDNETDGNFAYRVKAGYSHDGRASTEYTYNALCCLWNG